MNTSDFRIHPCSLRACSLASFALHSSTRTEKKCYMLLLYRPKPQVKPCCPKIINTTQQISSQTNSTTQLTRHALTVTHLFCMSLGTHVHLVYIYMYMHICRYIHIKKNIYIYVCICIHIYTLMCIHTHQHLICCCGQQPIEAFEQICFSAQSARAWSVLD